jgi:GDPmannose 4,6-dehydratase
LAFKEVGIELLWEGNGSKERGIEASSGRVMVEVDPKYFRPTEVDELLGDPSKAKRVLNWNPTRTSFPELVKKMVLSDVELVAREKRAKGRVR